MDLTKENKAHIDEMSHFDLLSKWRYAPVGDPWFQGETGQYWGARMRKLKDENPGGAVRDSKDIGWGL